MNATSACLTPDTLEQLSHDELTPVELRAVEAHLCECRRCRERLVEAEADELWRDQIAPALRSPGEAPPTACSLELDPLGEASLESVLKLLGPTDDPQMLGRIGSYEIVGVIGRGGMGVVLKAFDPALHRFVAIKMLLPHLAVSGAARQRFAREGKAAAAVIDDHVLPIYSVAEWRGAPYLVTQYLRGATLEARLASQGPLEVKEILRIAMQTAKGLAAAHAQGLVHRDVKPSNILLDGAVERAMLTDFGLARAADDASITRTGVIAGTPQYMSPEQARGGTVDGRSDLFGLGCVMYAMCTGRPPFRAESSYAILRLITDQEPRSIREINPEIPPWLCAIIGKLMAKEAADRYGSAAEVAQLLEACLAHLQHPTAVALPPSLSKIAAKTVDKAAEGPRGRAAGGRGWRGWPLLVACGLAAFALFAGVLIVLEMDKGTLTIESKVDDVKIKITQGEKVVRELTLEKSAQSLRIASGKYQIEVEGDSDAMVVENGQITLSRGGTEVVRILQQPGPRPAPAGDGESLAERWARTVDSLSFGRSLSLAVEEFNQEQQKTDLGKAQLPLTVDEVVASIEWSRDTFESEFSPEEMKYVSMIPGMLVLPEPFQIQVVTELRGVDQERFKVWFIQLTLKRPDGTEFRHNLRERFLCELDEQGKEKPFGGYPLWTPPEGWQRLDAAIESFNQRHGRLGGINMPPVTMEEVIAAIRYWKTQRAKFDATDTEFEALQEVANLGYLPAGAEFSIITHFQPGDGKEYLIWSLRLHLLKTEAGARFPQFGDVFRTHYVKARSTDEAKIAWGPVAKNGLQAGVLLKSAQRVIGAPRSYNAVALGGGMGAASSSAAEGVALGATIRPLFYFRNTGNAKLEAAFPQMMSREHYGEIEATLAGGERVAMETTAIEPDRKGWTKLPFAFGAQHAVDGVQILLGPGDHGEAESALRVQKGDRVRVRFTPKIYIDETAQPLTTDWVELVIE